GRRRCVVLFVRLSRAARLRGGGRAPGGGVLRQELARVLPAVRGGAHRGVAGRRLDGVPSNDLRRRRIVRRLAARGARASWRLIRAPASRWRASRRRRSASTSAATATTRRAGAASRRTRRRRGERARALPSPRIRARRTRRG